MGTNSYVGIVRDDRSVDYIWVKFDGSPESAGSILNCDFADIEDIEYLISRGNLRSLKNRHRQWWIQDQISVNKETTEENRCEVDTSKYGPYKIEDKYRLITKAREEFAEYIYIYEGGIWIVWTCYSKRRHDKWYPLGEFVEWQMGRICTLCGKIEAEHHKFDADEDERWFLKWIKKQK